MEMPSEVELKVVLDTEDALRQMDEIVKRVEVLQGRLTDLNLSYVELIKTLGNISVALEEIEDEE